MILNYTMNLLRMSFGSLSISRIFGADIWGSEGDLIILLHSISIM